MVKKTIIVLMMTCLPIIAFAQEAGGQIRRPAKKQETMNTPPKIKQTSNEEKPAKRKAVKPKSPKPSREAIIQKLINNMVYVEGGTFMMGATSEQGRNAQSDEKPAHQVTLSAFYIGKFEVTQEEWKAVMGDNPSSFKGPKRPVEKVNWNDCQEFIRKLNAMTGKRFRMPTEAEWEYAARGGNKSIGYKYSGSDNIDRVSWYYSNSGSKTHDVGQKLSNELGLYDMSGNVREWCQDRYDSYGSNSQTNPSGPSSGSNRVLRGGEWDTLALFCRVSTRDRDRPTSAYDNLGLRLALSLQESNAEPIKSNEKIHRPGSEKVKSKPKPTKSKNDNPDSRIVIL